MPDTTYREQNDTYINSTALLQTLDDAYIKVRNILSTYLLTPWYKVLFEKLTGLQLVKKFPAFHGTRMFITFLTSVRQQSLSWANSIQSTHPHPISWRYILILSTHLRPGLSSGLFPSSFPTKNLYASLPFAIRATCLPIPIFSILSPAQYWVLYLYLRE